MRHSASLIQFIDFDQGEAGQSRIDHRSLRFDPEWDSLRGDPRFERIVAELQPK
ncbi:MAG: hypothetical protein ABI839_08835 [Verrucomicrobiota bacterium]